MIFLSRVSIKHNEQVLLTACERMVPPVRLAQVSFEISGRSSNDNNRRCNQRSDDKKNTENGHYYSQSFQQVKIRYFHRFRRPHSENYRYSEKKQKQVQ